MKRAVSVQTYWRPMAMRHDSLQHTDGLKKPAEVYGRNDMPRSNCTLCEGALVTQILLEDDCDADAGGYDHG
uniref:Uncharacterized protein n=1 Tax=Rodentolepis nana TaxID=102285 RepID=A0A0R3U0J5_RODNA